MLYETIQSWQTRLIKLLPGEFHDGLEYGLYIADLVAFNGVGIAAESCVQNYEALSYSWGQPKGTKPISCKGTQLLIPPSTEDALRYLRFTNKSRWLWCDALCINQNDDKEKSMQVRNMQLIFRKASRVVAWLGVPEEPMSAMLTTAKRLQNRGVTEESASALYAILRESMAQLLTREWFSRTWVRQEVYSAEELVLVCGWQEVPFTTFVDLAKHLGLFSGQLGSLHDNFVAGKRNFSAGNNVKIEVDTVGIAPTLESVGYLEKGNPTSDFLHVLRTNSMFGASDHKDRVYGLLGMMPGIQVSRDQTKGVGKVSDIEYPIDYSKSVDEVYQDVIKFLINFHRTLDCLNTFADCKSETRRDGFASWAVDWRDAEACHNPVLHTSTVRMAQPPYQNLDDTGVLRLAGYKIWTVDRSTQHKVELDPTSIVSSKPWQKRVPELRHSNSSRHNALSRAVVSGKGLIVDEGKEPSDRLAELCDNGCFVYHRMGDRTEDLRWGLETIVAWDIVVPASARAGDIVTLMNGSECLHVFRRLPNMTDHYALVGIAWITYHHRTEFETVIPGLGPSETTYPGHILHVSQDLNRFHCDRLPSAIGRAVKASKANREGRYSDILGLEQFKLV